MGKRKKTHEFTDQYGEARSQDRDEHMGGAGRGGGSMRGGGSAGGGRGGGVNVNFQRQLPKFLQPYAHMLGKQGPSEDDPQTEGGHEGDLDGGDPRRRRGPADDDSDGDDDGGDEEAIQRALQENPQLAAELGERVTNKIQAAAEKEAGNKAFGAKQYEAAVLHFTKAVELDPSSEVYLSNRSAAYAALERYQAALDDARAVTRLKPRWAKGHARAAAALMGLRRYGEAREAYEAALKLEPDDQTLHRGKDKAYAMELQQMRENKHTFASKRPKGAVGEAAGAVGSASSKERGGGGGDSGGGGGGGGGGSSGGGASADAGKAPNSRGSGGAAGVGSSGASRGGGSVGRPIAAAKKDKKLLSFAADEDEEG
ncbi:stress-induced-phosphoprotein 1 [Monoraphidium neglectum]|uniref:Stress-induced-phosphoprotein 1 n=1 Tax=Monoraphidium neglectum TaxID=145388 RepID=A0A0D2MR03_9CHLO|nr:stress-induced-phosphoprotein 1 [Monoraphidium neglectum]KIZ02857.1 stress-induced-phosphoprotein 1 [Monoraphidium neglectum]|eukprot:XP_013901876.1 stress-induced-phosphoprotein 1 [Monoraphidium neglectum]